MKLLKPTLLLFSLYLFSLQTIAQVRVTQSLDFGWKFFLGDVENGASPTLVEMPNRCMIGSKDSLTPPKGWHTVNLPHDFQIEQP